MVLELAYVSSKSLCNIWSQVEPLIHSRYSFLAATLIVSVLLLSSPKEHHSGTQGMLLEISSQEISSQEKAQEEIPFQAFKNLPLATKTKNTETLES